MKRNQSKNEYPSENSRREMLLNLPLSKLREDNEDQMSNGEYRADSDVSDDRDIDYIPSSSSPNSSLQSMKNEDVTEKNVVVKNINIISDIVLTAASVATTSENLNFDGDGINEIYFLYETDLNYVHTLIEKVVLNAIDLSETKKLTKNGQPRKRRKIEESLAERCANKRQRLITKHKITGSCAVTCKKKCIMKVSGPRRLDINKQFWSLSSEEQKNFYLSSVSKAPKKRATTGNSADSRSLYSFNYTLKDSEGRCQDVCKTFFLKTLGFHAKNDKPLRTVVNSSHLSLKPEKDKRGGTSKKFDRDLIKNHIKSFNPSTSHYRREHAPNRLYLPSDVSIKLMYESFKAKYNVVCSYSLYRQMVAEMKISFAQLGHEECFTCEKYENHRKQTMHEPNSNDFVCPDCDSYKNHKQKYVRAREMYTSDSKKSTHSPVFTADLQKVIMLPRCDTFKEIVFTPRIIAFNESFVPVGASKNPTVAVVWHEAIAGRKKEDIVSTFFGFLKTLRDIEDVVIWLDNCSGQNKNWCLYTFLVHAINSNEFNFISITLRYFEVGHSFMAADSFHHRVELSLKRKGKVYDFIDFVDAVKKSSRNIEVIEMRVEDFHVWKGESSQYKLKKLVPRPYLNEMVEVQFTRGVKTFSYKTSFDGPVNIVNFLNSKCQKIGISKLEKKIKPRGITLARKQTIIQKLGAIVPKNRLKFWEDLPVSDSQGAIDD